MPMPEPYALPYSIPFDLHGFIAQNEALLKTPPTNVKALWRNTDFIAFLVGGPNRRLDFHDDPFEEFFYQIRGDIHINIMTDLGPARVDVPEGHQDTQSRHLGLGARGVETQRGWVRGCVEEQRVDASRA